METQKLVLVMQVACITSFWLEKFRALCSRNITPSLTESLPFQWSILIVYMTYHGRLLKVLLTMENY